MANCLTGGDGLINACKLPQSQANPDTLQHILTISFTLIGALALLMLVIAGLRYVLTQGEPQKTAEIRRQIIYIAVGLVLATSADVIVTFVLGRTG
jgi:hypothetical protein